MFEYRGRRLNINEKYLSDYKKYTVIGLTEDQADTFIYNEYIWNRDKENQIPAVVQSMSDDELVRFLESELIDELRYYTCNKDYGAS